jgi:arylformamidase
MFEYKNIIDISLPLNAESLLYPGDPAIVIEPEMHDGKLLPRLSKIILGSHSGSHIDAPSHFVETGKTVDHIPLKHFIGSCRVLDMTHCMEAVTKADLTSCHIELGERILLKTKNSLLDYRNFRTDYIYLASDAASYLSELPIALIGIDYLSVKQKGAVDNTAHMAFLEKNIPILESICLANVEPGSYFLAALPLAFTAIDGSPVRAVLLQ